MIFIIITLLLHQTPVYCHRIEKDWKNWQIYVYPAGLVKDGSKTLRELNVTNGVKMMVVGSTMNDVMKVTPPPPGALKEEKIASGKEHLHVTHNKCSAGTPLIPFSQSKSSIPH